MSCYSGTLVIDGPGDVWEETRFVAYEVHLDPHWLELESPLLSIASRWAGGGSAPLVRDVGGWWSVPRQRVRRVEYEPCECARRADGEWTWDRSTGAAGPTPETRSDPFSDRYRRRP